MKYIKKLEYILISEDGEPPLTPAEQAFNSYMGSQRPTQADSKPKEDE